MLSTVVLDGSISTQCINKSLVHTIVDYVIINYFATQWNKSTLKTGIQKFMF